MMWFLSPLAVYAVVAGSMCLCIYLFVSAKKDLRLEQKAWGVSRAALEGQLQRMQEEVEALRFTMRAPAVVEEEPVMMETAVVETPRPAPVAPMEERTRTEALALSKAGFPMERIAPVLQLPENEVELLLKIQRLTA